MMYQFRFGIVGLALMASTLFVAGCASTKTQTEERKEYTPTEKAQVQLDLASALYREGDLIGTLEHILRAEKLDSKNAEIYHLKALALYGKSQFKDALVAARRAVEINPKYPDARNTLGKMLLDQGMAKDAERELRISANDLLYRETYKPQTNLGILYYRQGKFAIAQSAFVKAVQSSPERACQAHYYLGHLALKEGKFTDGVSHYERAARGICASFPDAHLAVGIAFERKQDFGKARKKYLDVASAFPETPVATQALERLKKLP